ncbi:lycopene beta-cyclase CrtY [uncultured Parasphingopyxis sp.]|uniref:lycopene beta-cyclase CrtY n=1 Tax=uncultured Parasphingopyxis sp. TaxID=1547918 RepID=UPI00262BEC6D|nr:lycopene beta-cyclase CrtY [uncultured Parasphingopyxis sp.]
MKPTMATGPTCDVAILGGGLAGGLIALELHRRRPDLSVLVVEESEKLGGNHRWSFFESDVDADGMALLGPMIGRSWDGYEVRFPAHRRELDTRYHTIKSSDFERVLRDTLPREAIRSGDRVLGATTDAVVLSNGERIEAGGVIDARGAGDLTLLECGWQKFVGVEIETEEPHGQELPVVMDATVEQIDGYRFVYVLPLSGTRIFIEDTYYSNLPAMDAKAIEQRCLDYAETKGWIIDAVVHREKGVLPVTCTGGKFGEYWRSGGKAAKAGVRAGLFHPVTGYSLPDAVRTAQMVAKRSDFSGEALRDAMLTMAAGHWRAGGFYRMLDTMMFRGAGTEDRYKILERFYTLDAGLIERFYAGRSRWSDKLRIVSGKPPIPVGRGLKALMGSKA